MPRYIVLVLLLAVHLVASPAQAIVTFGGKGRMLVPKTRVHGAQFIGEWNGFTGTAIGPYHFLTAAHVGGVAGSVFLLNGKKYTAESQNNIPGTDLSVWRVTQRLPRWADLYDKPDEVGKEITLFGRGCTRGKPVYVENKLRGWLWGKTDGLLSWGRNRVDATLALPGNSDTLVFSFDASGGNDEGTVGQGDSGGAVFLQDGATWKLAGINFASGGQYSRTNTGQPTFMAALFDARGLYQNTGATWGQYNPNAPQAAPTLAFASRVSSHVSAIRALIADQAKSK